jgi:hypothetical protein
LQATLSAADLARIGAKGCPTHPDVEGEAHCDCPFLGPPPATDAYTPTDRQQQFVRTRDRTCRMPNCPQRVGWGDLDHVVPHSCDGATTCTNLCCLCRSHHRLKTFARGWDFRMDPDGTLHVTSPSGVTRTTRPPGLRRRDAEPPRAEPPGSAAPAGLPAEDDEPEDPPPF